MWPIRSEKSAPFTPLSDVAFVGGSLIAHGGQNPVEAIKHDTAILTGPHWRNQADVYRALLRNGGATEVKDADELVERAIQLLTDEAFRSETAQHAREVVSELAGALERTVDALVPFLISDEDVKRAS